MANRGDIIGNSNLGRQRLAVWGGTASLMIVPILVEDQFVAANRDHGDFIFLAILVTGVGAIYELAAKTSGRRTYRTALGIAIAAVLLEAWINLAVGIIGSEDNPANLIYAGVIAVALCGAIAARFRAAGMAFAMLAAAIAQFLAFIAAMIAGLGFTGPITVFFCALWLISAWLFRRAARHASTDSGSKITEARQ